jgi:hypothetical protein
MEEPVWMFLTTRVPLLVNLRSAVVAVVGHLSWEGLDLMGAVRLRFPEGKLVGMRCLNGSGQKGAQAYELPTTVVSASMFACDRYFWESRVLAELLSLDRLEVAGSSVAWSESSSVYLAPSFVVRSRSMNQSSQFSPAQPLHARPSVVAQLPLLYWFGVTGYSVASESPYFSLPSSFVVIPKPVKPSSQLSPLRARRSVVAELLYQSRMSK